MIKRYRFRFEPIDIEANSPDEAMEILDSGAVGSPDVRKIYLIDEYGFPLNPDIKD